MEFSAAGAEEYKEVVKAEKEKDGMKYYECEIDGQKKTVYSVKGMGLCVCNSQADDRGASQCI